MVGTRREQGDGGTSKAARDDEAGFLVSVLRPFVIATAVYAVVAWLPGMERNPRPTFLFVDAMFVISVAMLILARRGRVVLAGHIFLVTLLATVTAATVIFGFRSAMPATFPVVVLFAGLIRGWRTAQLYAVLAGLVLTSLVGANLFGLVEPHYVAPSLLPAFVTTLACVVLVAVYLSQSLRRLTRARAAAKRSERRLSDLIRNSPDGFLFFSDDGVVEDCNLQAEALSGRERSDLVGRRLDDLDWLDGASRSRLAKAFETVLREDVAELVELELAAGAGGATMVEAHVKVFAHEGAERSIQVVARDLSERKERESLQRQLREAQRLESLGRLAGGVAHDFNNLLMVVMGNCDLLAARSSLEPAAKEHLDQIAEAGDRAAALTQQLLTFARRQVTEPKVLDINGVVRDLEGLLRRLLPENIAIQIIPCVGALRMRGDPSQIEQVIVNLAINARDAMPAGGQLTVETARVELDAVYCEQHGEVEPGDFVRLTVTDTGMGMPPETLAHIFEPFFTTKGREQGTGLGLATVHGIVKQGGGHIFVYSEPERGTCFKVYFPAVDAEVDATAEAPPEVGASRREVVLVVDDSDGVRDTLGKLLEVAGYEVLTAAEGEAALALEEEHPGTIDLLLTDVIMPKMSGRELAEQMLERRPEMKVLFMSGYTENAIVRGGELEEGLHFLPKPATAKALWQKLREILGPTGGQSG